jgi:hypothetical protein
MTRLFIAIQLIIGICTASAGTIHYVKSSGTGNSSSWSVASAASRI